MDQNETDFEQRFESLWEKASLSQKFLVAGRAIARAHPVLLHEGGFGYWDSSTVFENLSEIHRAAILPQLEFAIASLDSSVYEEAVDNSLRAAENAAFLAVANPTSGFIAGATYSDAALAAASFAPADYFTDGDSEHFPADASCASAVDRSTRALANQFPELGTQFQEVVVKEFEFLVHQSSDSETSFLRVAESPLYHSLGKDDEFVHEFVERYCYALRKHDLEKLADQYENQAFNPVSVNTMQEWALGEIVKEFPLLPNGPKWYEQTLPPNEERPVKSSKHRDSVAEQPKAKPYLEDEPLNDLQWWPTFLYHLAISDRQHLPLLSDPDPEKIAEVMALLIRDKHPDCLSELHQTVKHKLEQSLESSGRKADDLRPPTLWLAWLKNIHKERLEQIPSRVRGRLVGEGTS